VFCGQGILALRRHQIRTATPAKVQFPATPARRTCGPDPPARARHGQPRGLGKQPAADLQGAFFHQGPPPADHWRNTGSFQAAICSERTGRWAHRKRAIGTTAASARASHGWEQRLSFCYRFSVEVRPFDQLSSPTRQQHLRRSTAPAPPGRVNSAWRWSLRASNSSLSAALLVQAVGRWKDSPLLADERQGQLLRPRPRRCAGICETVGGCPIT